MTPKQEERIRNNIAKIRKELAADKQRWGGFHHDGKGLRYLPPGLFIKIRDYKGALRYLRWFDRTFSDDSGYPIFLFEWALILFKTGKLKEAEKKVVETYFSNTYLLSRFLKKELVHVEKWEGSNWQTQSLAEQMDYTKDDPELRDFSDWLIPVVSSETFQRCADEFIEIQKKLKTEPVGPTRSRLVKREFELRRGYL